MDREKIKSLTQKQIKAIKGECVEGGVINRGYFTSILDTQEPTEIIGIVHDLAAEGLDIAKWDETTLNIAVVDEMIRQSSYQEFKNILLPHIFG